MHMLYRYKLQLLTYRLKVCCRWYRISSSLQLSRDVMPKRY